MNYKTIVVHLDSRPQANVLLDAALQLSVANDARLVGVYSELPVESRYFDAVAGSTWPLEEIEPQTESTYHDLNRHFDDAARAVHVRAEWRAPQGFPNDVLAWCARHADLLVLGQPNPREKGTFNVPNFVENVLLSAGCPILLVPHASETYSISIRPMLAWNSSREAARAWRDALPLLKHAPCTLIAMLTNPESSASAADSQGAEIKAALACHGVNAEIHMHPSAPHREQGEVLLSMAVDLGADMIVAGAYGHTRVTQMIMGGVTRTLLRTMTLPVLMSH